MVVGELRRRVVVESSSCRRRSCLQLFHLVVALPLHASVLEPDLDLSLGETELVGQLGAPSTRQIAVEVEFFLELERLVAGVRRPSALRVAVTAVYITYHRHHRHQGFIQTPRGVITPGFYATPPNMYTAKKDY